MHSRDPVEFTATGPKDLFEGPYGLEQMFAQSIPVDWEDPSLDIVKQTIMKKYCSLIHGPASAGSCSGFEAS
jgi:hypothetical protein